MVSMSKILCNNWLKHCTAANSQLLRLNTNPTLAMYVFEL